MFLSPPPKSQAYITPILILRQIISPYPHLSHTIDRRKNKIGSCGEKNKINVEMGEERKNRNFVLGFSIFATIFGELTTCFIFWDFRISKIEVFIKLSIIDVRVLLMQFFL